jgi:shikimate kinase
MATFRTSQAVSAADSSIPHLILVGLPGSGKSTVGALLADALARPLLDFDAEITRREGMAVPEIFGQKGEGHFRELEHALTEELTECGGMVLAPGGGWVTRPDNLALLRPPGRLVYLKITTSVAVLRMGASATSRPLLNRPNPKAELDRLLSARILAYESADVVVNVDQLDPQAVTQRVMELIKSGKPASSGFFR